MAIIAENIPWVLPADRARELVAKGALVIDARGEALRHARPLAGAVPFAWQRLSHPNPDKGRLLDDEKALALILSGIGLRNDTAAIVVADSIGGGGEDGRIVWALRTLGHTGSALIDGGIHAFLQDGAPEIIAQSIPGTFAVRRTHQWEISREQMRATLGAANAIFLYVRERREYEGETPYGESRGGHVPGAKHLYYRDLIRPDGRLVDRSELAERLTDLAIAGNSEIVAYCTGGVRAGFVTAILNAFGYRARNYAGSMWQWAADDEELFPLVTWRRH